MSRPYDAVLLIAFGGPTGPEEIRPFLARVTKGIPIPPERLEEVVHHYEAVGGKSPFNEITFRQANALQESLKNRNSPLRVYVGMRNASPFFTETFKRMAADGMTRALGVILSSLRTEASWERYQQNVAAARAAQGLNVPEIDYCVGWHDHPRFIQTWAEQIEACLAKIPPDKRLTIVYAIRDGPTYQHQDRARRRGAGEHRAGERGGSQSRCGVGQRDKPHHVAEI